jgi:hypothetical protein
VQTLLERPFDVFDIDVRRNDGYWSPGDRENCTNWPFYVDIVPHPGIDHPCYLTALTAFINDLIAQGYSAEPACFGFDERDLGDPYVDGEGNP